MLVEQTGSALEEEMSRLWGVVGTHDHGVVLEQAADQGGIELSKSRIRRGQRGCTLSLLRAIDASCKACQWPVK